MNERMSFRKWIAPFCVGVFLSSSGVSCEGDSEIERAEGWDQETHSKDVDPNYEILFAADIVHRLDITIEPDQFAIMQEDLAELLGDSGDMGGGMEPGMKEKPTLTFY